MDNSTHPTTAVLCAARHAAPEAAIDLPPQPRAVGACGDILRRLVDADTFAGAHGVHLRSCQPCRTTTHQFAAITDFAHTNALAPSPHFARSLALIVAGFFAAPSTAPLHD